MVLWTWGEPFLNPDIFKMIKYAVSRDILVHSSTNGNVVFDDAAADKLVGSGLTSLVFAMDGATQETYRKYRAGGDLERVKENIRTVVRAKRRNSSPFPRLNLRFVAMKHNEHELPQVEQLAHELGVDFFSVKSVDMPENREKDLDQKYRPENDKYRRYEYVTGTYARKDKPFVCMRPWKRITMDAQGELISCEYDYKNLHSFGNIGNGHSTLEAWKSSISRTFRKHFNKGHNDAYYHCKGCTYKGLRTDDCNLYAYPIPSTPN
jgi:radical SAM protein with 4Fe4S-binding SPASM domain